VQFLTHVVSFDIPEWMLLEQVDECEQLPSFLSSEKCGNISMGKDCWEFVAKYLMRNVVVHKDYIFFLLLFKSKGDFFPFFFLFKFKGNPRGVFVMGSE